MNGEKGMNGEFDKKLEKTTGFVVLQIGDGFFCLENRVWVRTVSKQFIWFLTNLFSKIPLAKAKNHKIISCLG